MLVLLNSEPTIADGFIDVEVDGKHLIHHSNIKFNASNHSKGLIQTMMFNTFFGGSQPDWAPRYPDGRLKTDCAYFDDFQVTSV